MDSFSCTLYDEQQLILGRTENTLWRLWKPVFFFKDSSIKLNAHDRIKNVT